MAATSKTPLKPTNKLADVQLQVDQVKAVMHANIEKTIERGQSLEVIEEKANQLDQEARKFFVNSRSLKRHMCWKNAKYTVLVVLAIAVIVVIALAALGAFKNVSS